MSSQNIYIENSSIIPIIFVELYQFLPWVLLRTNWINLTFSEPNSISLEVSPKGNSKTGTNNYNITPVSMYFRLKKTAIILSLKRVWYSILLKLFFGQNTYVHIFFSFKVIYNLSLGAMLSATISVPFYAHNNYWFIHTYIQKSFILLDICGWNLILISEACVVQCSLYIAHYCCGVAIIQ